MVIAEDQANTVLRVATEVARGGTRTQRDDFVADAVSEVFGPRAKARPRVELYDSSVGPFEPWVATTLRNLWRSRLRPGRQRSAAIDPHVVTRYATPAIPWGRIVDHLGTPYSAPDLARIDGFQPCVRVELLSVSGLYVKLAFAESAGRWDEYLDETEPIYNRPIARPFPPAETDSADCPEPGDRIRLIADALGIRPNTLSQRWKRKHHLLETLDFLRELRAAAIDRRVHS